MALYYRKYAWYTDLRDQERVYLAAEDVVFGLLPGLLLISTRLDASRWVCHGLQNYRWRGFA
jgi:hypothetical protein